LAGHEIINPFGQVIKVTRLTYDALDMRGYLHRDQVSGLKGMDGRQCDIFMSAELGQPWFYELGPQFTGAACLMCGCQDCLMDP